MLVAPACSSGADPQRVDEAATTTAGVAATTLEQVPSAVPSTPEMSATPTTVPSTEPPFVTTMW